MPELTKTPKWYLKNGAVHYTIGSFLNPTITNGTEVNLFTQVLQNDSVNIIKQTDTRCLLKACRKYKITTKVGTRKFPSSTSYAYFSLKDYLNNSLIGTKAIQIS